MSRHEPTVAALREGIALSLDESHVVVVPMKAAVHLLEVTPFFAPGEEIFEPDDLENPSPGEHCAIEYEIFDPSTVLTSARIEIARQSTGEVLALFELEEDARTHGTHTFEWDGVCTQGPMAGRTVHAVHSPYAVRIVATGPTGEIDDAAKETAVQLASILLERGRDVLGDPPAPGSLAHYQLRLAVLGFHPGEIDGDIGSKSRRAIQAFQRAHGGLRPTGTLDAYTRAYLDETAPAGTGIDHYQFILDYLGYRCGTIDGLLGRRTRRAVERYRADRNLGPGDALDAIVKAALDGEALGPLTRREVLEDDLDFDAPHENPFPAPGEEKKVFIDCDGCFSPGSLPRRQKHGREQSTLLRPHFPIVVRPLVTKSDGTAVFAPSAVGPLPIDFTVDVAPPPADLGIPNATARAYVEWNMGRDGAEDVTGHHAHRARGGVRADQDPGTFLAGQHYGPYRVVLDENRHVSICVETPDDPARGTAGIYLVPSTIAGDRFAAVATVDADTLDDPPDDAIEERTGTLVVWRRYLVAKRWFMEYVPRPHRTQGDQLGLTDWFEPAFIEFVDPEDNPQPRMIQPRGGDHEEIDLALYTHILRTAGYRETQLSAAQIQQRFDDNILWPLTAAAVFNPANQQAYRDAIDAEIFAFEQRFARALRELSRLEAPEGLVVLVFDRNAPAPGTHGIAPIAGGGWGWSLLAEEAVVHLIHDQDAVPGAIDGETFAHEVGHALWLHHASTAAGSDPHPANQPDHNPDEWQTCTMSYVSLANFCGHCVLKLRGWNEQQVSSPPPP